ncbi:MAG: aminopeptidase [Bacteroidetes bacterium]|nr:aminopeptidase [Bacteroidota bacterium]
MGNTINTITPLSGISYDPAYTHAAENAIRTCLRVQPGERATLITDIATKEIAASLFDELVKVGANVHSFVVEDYAERPLQHMPAEILEDLENADVSIYCMQGQENELQTRKEMMSVVNRIKPRHAHMVNINHEIMCEGMQADFKAVDAISIRVWELAKQAKKIVAKSPAGTHIEATFSPDLKWLKTSGIISREKWGNLPGGEVLTCPARVDGVYVVDGVVGDYLCAKYGDLKATPLTIHVTDSRITKCECANQELLEEFLEYTHRDENSDRVGEFAIGTNIGVADVRGLILQDEKIPGCHIAFGYPYCEHTGATWYSGTHIDVVGRAFDIWIDDLQIMERGKFLIKP